MKTTFKQICESLDAKNVKVGMVLRNRNDRIRVADDDDRSFNNHNYEYIPGGAIMLVVKRGYNSVVFRYIDSDYHAGGKRLSVPDYDFPYGVTEIDLHKADKEILDKLKKMVEKNEGDSKPGAYYIRRGTYANAKFFIAALRDFGIKWPELDELEDELDVKTIIEKGLVELHRVRNGATFEKTKDEIVKKILSSMKSGTLDAVSYLKSLDKHGVKWPELEIIRKSVEAEKRIT